MTRSRRSTATSSDGGCTGGRPDVCYEGRWSRCYLLARSRNVQLLLADGIRRGRRWFGTVGPASPGAGGVLRDCDGPVGDVPGCIAKGAAAGAGAASVSARRAAMYARPARSSSVGAAIRAYARPSTAKSTATPIGISSAVALAPASWPVGCSTCAVIADMPVKCMPFTATPMIRADAMMAAALRTVTASQSATVAATTAMAPR